MMKRFCACLLTALLMMSSAFAAVGVDAFVADKDENYIPIPAAYEVYTTFKNLDDYGFMNHPEDIFIGKDNLLYVADTENNRVLVMKRAARSSPSRAVCTSATTCPSGLPTRAICAWRR